jgi:hypothetical protein
LLGSRQSLQTLPNNRNLPTLSLRCNGHLLRRKNSPDQHSLILQKCRLEHLLQGLRSLESKVMLLHQSRVAMMVHPCHLYHTNELDSLHSCHKEMASELRKPSATPELHLCRIRSSRITGRSQALL